MLQNKLYDILDKNDNSLLTKEQKKSTENLIEPLIQKIESYEFRTKTKVSDLTENAAVEGSGADVPRKTANKSLSQWEGNKATITDTTGKTTTGILKGENGNYVVIGENGEKVPHWAKKPSQTGILRYQTIQKGSGTF